MIETFKMNDSRIEEFFSSARERYEIFLKKQEGKPHPLTEDVAFANWRFCNVFREDDKVTRWIRKFVREPLRNSDGVLVAMTACRFFNRIESLQRLNEAGVLSGKWDSVEARKAMKGAKPVVGAAYVVKTPDGMDKLDGVLHIVDHVQQHSEHLTSHLRELLDSGEPISLQGIHEALLTLDFFGNFMAYEIVSDLRHTWMGERATDINSWAFPGPGAARGLSWLVNGDLESIPYGSKSGKESMLRTMQHLLVIAQKVEWPKEWPRWEMREVEHWLCEYAKYVKVHHLGKRMKQKYP